MSDNHRIPLSTAVEMTSLYRENRNSILGNDYQGLDILPICETFDMEAIQSIINQTNYANFRIYYGMDKDLKVHAILVGADADGNDILTSGDEVIMEDAVRCPTICPPESPLNG
jgi:hypothetical protein